MIRLENLSLRRGPEPLFEQATLSIFPGEKVGIVGRNGCGKSSLLAAICGELPIDDGVLELPARVSVSTVAQELPSGTRAAIEFVIDGDSELRQIENDIAAARARSDGHTEAVLLHDYELLGGYTARSRAASILDGLGFDATAIDRPLDEFSGGLRMRAALARALMRRADILILDEPTNHLDLDAVLWLENFLRNCKATLLLVSHDREFLDGVVTRILHFRERKLRAWSGNYSRFELTEAAERTREAALAARQQVRVRQVQGFVERFRAKASKARQVQSRIKWLDRLPAILEARQESSIDWEFLPLAKLPQPLLTLERASCGYGERRVLKQVSLTIANNERLGILGRNGAGKSTLMRLLAGELSAQQGATTAAADLKVGFFAQMELEQLTASATPLEELGTRGGDSVAHWTLQQKRDHLGRFGFSGDRVFAPSATFSGGERARLTLAILVARRPNMLLLDEPTNHLDLEMRDSLLLALQSFAGAVIVVAHDRALLRGICDRFVIVEGGGVHEFDGDLEDYAARLARGSGTTDVTARDNTSTAVSPIDRREQRRREAEARNRLTPLRQKLRELEQKLEKTTAQLTAFDAQLADGEYCAKLRSEEYAQLAQKRALAQAQVAEIENDWLVFSEQLERLTYPTAE